MADKPISGLSAASKVHVTDLFVLEQDGAAKKLTGSVLKNWLLELAEGHGGIKSISKRSTSGLTDTYRITFADESTFDYDVTNGRSIVSIEKVRTWGLKDTYRISYNDGNYNEFVVTNGETGSMGLQTYVYIKWASEMPSDESSAMGNIPDRWMGIYTGTEDEEPTDWWHYSWVRVEGRSAYEQAVEGGYEGTEEQFEKHLAYEYTTYLLDENSNLNTIVDTGMYYITENKTAMRNLLDAAGIVHPTLSYANLVPSAIFLNVVKGYANSNDYSNSNGQPQQHLKVYYTIENSTESFAYEFDRIHNNVGYEADGSSWGAWLSENKKNNYEWSDLGEKTISIDALTWTGRIKDRNLVAFNHKANLYAYKVSDAILTLDDLINGGTITIFRLDDDSGITEDEIEWSNQMVWFNSTGFIAADAVLIVPEDNYTLHDNDPIDLSGENVVFPKAGLYFAYWPDDSLVGSASGYPDPYFARDHVSKFTVNGVTFGKQTIVPVPAKYLPMGDIIAAVKAQFTNVAEVGA
jgi:hypothetical protein